MPTTVSWLSGQKAQGLACWGATALSGRGACVEERQLGQPMKQCRLHVKWSVLCPVDQRFLCLCYEP